jgi:hypothetical protein
MLILYLSVTFAVHGSRHSCHLACHAMRSIHLRAADRFHLAMNTAVKLATGQLDLEDLSAWCPRAVSLCATHLQYQNADQLIK